MSIDNKFDQELIGKIKEKKLSPTPRWHFLLKDYVVWGMGIFSVIMGAMAFSVIAYMLSYNDWDLHERFAGSFAEFVLLTLPYFWIIFLVIFLVIIRYNIKHTKIGYRYSVSQILIASVVSSFLLGGVFFAAGIGKKIDDIMGKRMPMYEKIINHRVSDWNHPEEGRLVGMVISKNSDESFVLADIERREWDIQASSALMLPMAVVEIGNPARLLGRLVDADSFQAEQILPAMGPGRMFFGRGRDENFPPDMKKFNPQKGGMFSGEPRCGRSDDLSASIEKHPELKRVFIENLLQNKEMINMIIEKDLDFARQLELMNIDLGLFK